MELLSSSRPSAGEPTTRRAWLIAPLGAAGIAVWYLTRQPALPDAGANGSGEEVTVVLFDDQGHRQQTARVRKLVKTTEEWKKQLGPEAFAITREQATEFAFHNLYWNNHKAGMYRCVCCGNALFASKDKFDSDTGWPSFTAPMAAENILSKADRSLGMERTEVVCRKCDGHLGHVFDDGPAPTFKRYCMNSASLRFIAYA